MCLSSGIAPLSRVNDAGIATCLNQATNSGYFSPLSVLTSS